MGCCEFRFCSAAGKGNHGVRLFIACNWARYSHEDWDLPAATGSVLGNAFSAKVNSLARPAGQSAIAPKMGDKIVTHNNRKLPGDNAKVLKIDF